MNIFQIVLKIYVVPLIESLTLDSFLTLYSQLNYIITTETITHCAKYKLYSQKYH